MEALDHYQDEETTQIVDDLPGYSVTASNTLPVDNGQPISPPSERRIQGVTIASRRTTETVSTLDDKANLPWLSLILTSKPYSSSLPSFVEGQPIQGRVVIDLAKPQSIDSVLITVRILNTFTPHPSLQQSRIFLGQRADLLHFV